MYCFIRWKRTEAGYAPDVPEGVGFLVLAEPARASDGPEFGLMECCLPEGCEESKGMYEVSDDLEELLDSAKAYPPALALMREDLAPDECPSEIEFARRLVERLIFHLQRQIRSPFLMAKAKRTEFGYKQAGGYYWIVGYKDESVLWVSRDYQVYRDPLGDFELDVSEVERRFHGTT